MFFYQISTLTAEVDVINSTTNTTEKPTLDARPGDGDDVFIAGGSVATLNPGDTLDGMGGLNTLKIYGAEAGLAAFSAASIKNIQTVEFHAAGTGKNLDVSGNADVKTVIGVDALDANTQIMTATLAQTVGFKGAMAVTQTVTFKDVTGSADKATIMLDGASAATGLTVAGIEELSFSVAGKNEIGTLTADAAAKLVISGEGSFKAALSNAALYKTIDAGANKGGIDIDASAATAAEQLLDIKGGSGDDRYTTLFAHLTKDDKIDLGVDASTGVDTLVFKDATDLSAAAGVKKLGGVTGVEAIEVIGTGLFKADAALLSQDTFIHASTGAFTGTNFSSTDKLVIGAVGITDSTVGMATGESTLHLELAGSKTHASDASNLTVTGASTVDVLSTGSFATANSLALVTKGNGTVNLTGSQALTATFGVGGDTQGLMINGSGFQGKLDITGSAKADIINGGSAADTFHFTSAAGGLDKVHGNGGADTFEFAADSVGKANMVTIEGISAGDKINVKVLDTGTFASTRVDVTSAGADLDAAIGLADGTQKVLSWFQFDNDTYLVGADDAPTTITGDTIVKLAGLHDLNGAQFAADVLTIA